MQSCKRKACVASAGSAERERSGGGLAAGVIELGIAGIVFWPLPQFWKTAVPAPTPPRDSIAILPFAAAPGNPADVLGSIATLRLELAAATIATLDRCPCCDRRRELLLAKQNYLVEGRQPRRGFRSTRALH